MTPRAVVIELPGLEWDGGAPLPVVVANDDSVRFMFYAPDGRVRTAEFEGCVSVRFGFPNDEVLHGHSLWSHGLVFCSTHEVIDSPWIEELRTVELVHQRSPSHPFADVHHYLLTFHDSTLEAVARGIRVGTTHESAEAAFAEITADISSASRQRVDPKDG